MGETRGEGLIAAWKEWMDGQPSLGSRRLGLAADAVMALQRKARDAVKVEAERQNGQRAREQIQQQVLREQGEQKQEKEQELQRQQQQQQMQQLAEGSPSLTDGSEDWVLVSSHWDSQPTVLRLVRALRARGYLAWLDPACHYLAWLDPADGEDEALRKGQTTSNPHHSFISMTVLQLDPHSGILNTASLPRMALTDYLWL